MRVVSRHTVASLRRQWVALAAPRLEDLAGSDFEAAFVSPLRYVGPPGLTLLGLPRWFGKRFRGTGTRLTGVNLLLGDGGVTERLPMWVEIGPSLADDEPAALVHYAVDAPRPWRWVRDELRVLDDRHLVGMTYVDLPGLRRLSRVPFLLARVRT